MSTENSRAIIKVQPNQVKKGDLMALIYWVRVDSTDPFSARMQVTDLVSGSGSIRVEGAELIRNSPSADFFGKEESVSMTNLCNILCESYNRPLSICFIKKDGTTRILRGRWLAEVKKMGQSLCEDLDIAKTDKEDGIRNIDHRTIQWLVVDGIKYTLKKH